MSNSEKKERAKWFPIAFPQAPKDMPPVLNLAEGKPYYVKFKEASPRLVKAGYGRLVPVINVECEGRPFTLFLSHVDLARRMQQKEDRFGSLEDLVMKITNKGKRKGKRNYIFDVVCPVVEIEDED
jgi:hypothetical protein